MKTFLLPLIALFSLVFSAGTVVWAQQEVSPSTGGTGTYEENRIDSLHFKIEKTRLELTATLETSVQNNDQESVNGKDTYLDKASSSYGTLTLNYGITDDLSVSLSGTDELLGSRSSEDETSGFTGSSTATGISNANIHASYRFFGGLSGDQFAQLSVDYSPSLGTASQSRPSSGGPSAQAEVSYNKVLGVHELLAAVFFQNIGSSSYQNNSNNNYSTVSNSVSRAFGEVAYRFHSWENYFADLYAYYYPGYTTTYTEPNRNDFSYSAVRSNEFVPGINLGMRLDPSSAMHLNYYMQNFTTNFNYPNGQSQGHAVYNQQFLALSYSHVF